MRYVLLLLALCLFVAWMVWWRFLAMPGRSFTGERPKLTDSGQTIRQRLEAHVVALATTIGPRNSDHPEALAQASQYIQDQWREEGYSPHIQSFREGDQVFENLWVDIPGTTHPDELVIVGAHYDSCMTTPGADDNASGTAGILELARLLRERPAGPTLRLAAFTNEEPPFFKGRLMGSLVMAKSLRKEKARIRGMISLEMLGDFRDEPGSQLYPAGLEWFFPSQGNFLGFVGNHASRSWVRKILGEFRKVATIPSVGIASPSGVIGVDLSDHWSFWQNGYPAFMITDGGPFRNTRYHTSKDTPDTLDYDRMARGIEALATVLANQ